MILTKEQVQNDLDALPELYKTRDVDRLICRYVKAQADVSVLRPHILSRQQFRRIYYDGTLDQIKRLGERMAFIHEDLLFSDWWHTDQIISFARNGESGNNDMDSVNKTLYIPLCGKAYVSRKGIILHDPKAEEIWAAEGFALKGKSKSKWLAYYMGMRSAVFDRWLKAKMNADLPAVILHIGCGMDSRCERVGAQGHLWFDIDFPDVISERKRYYRESEDYKMICADVRSADWLSQVPAGNAIAIMEGVSMYLSQDELKQTLGQIAAHFENVSLLADCYTEFAAKASKIKNPINDVGVTQVYGLDDPKWVEGNGLSFVGEHEMTPADLVDGLHGMEKMIFKTLFAGSIAKKMYRLYEYGR